MIAKPLTDNEILKLRDVIISTRENLKKEHSQQARNSIPRNQSKEWYRGYITSLVTTISMSNNAHIEVNGLLTEALYLLIYEASTYVV